MKAPIPTTFNRTQVRFNELCEKGGGRGGGPLREVVQKLLSDDGKALNEKTAYPSVSDNLKHFSGANPWHVCFALGVAWGHLADGSREFVEAAVDVLADNDAAAMGKARKHHFERGPLPIEQSLTGGHIMFSRVRLPDTLPTDLKRLGQFQQRWWTPILSKDRPPYIGSWNATAMFMIALFSQPDLAKTMTEPEVLLPPGGPIFTGLRLLHNTNILSRPPAGSALDDQSVEPGAVYENNDLFAELRKGRVDWSLVDVHSGVYLLGTRDRESGQWY